MLPTVGRGVGQGKWGGLSPKYQNGQVRRVSMEPNKKVRGGIQVGGGTWLSGSAGPCPPQDQSSLARASALGSPVSPVRVCQLVGAGHRGHRSVG